MASRARIITIIAFMSFSRLEASQQFQPPDTIRRATVVIVIHHSNGEHSGGTGFLVNIRNEISKEPSLFLATARHVVEPGFCSEHIELSPSIEVQLSIKRASGEIAEELVSVPLQQGGRQLWFSPNDKQLDLAVVRLRKDFLKDSAETPLSIGAIAKSSQIAEFARPGSSVTLLGWQSGGLNVNHKDLQAAKGFVEPIPTTPLLWTGTCTKALKNILLKISIMPGNSGGPVYYTTAGLFKRRTVVLGIISAGSPPNSEAGVVTANYLRTLLQLASKQP